MHAVLLHELTAEGKPMKRNLRLSVPKPSQTYLKF